MLQRVLLLEKDLFWATFRNCGVDNYEINSLAQPTAISQRYLFSLVWRRWLFARFLTEVIFARDISIEKLMMIVKESYWSLGDLPFFFSR